MTTWTPDTCTCKVRYERDPAVLPPVVKYIVLRVLAYCPAHRTVASDQLLLETLLEENSRKNAVLDALQKLLNIPTFDANDKMTPEYSALIEAYVFSFDSQRNLAVKFNRPLTATQKQTLQNTMDTRFGAGKVVVQ